MKRIFTNKQEQQIIAKYQAGTNGPELALFFQCATESIYNVLKRHKCQPRLPGFQKQDAIANFHKHYTILHNGCWQWVGFIAPNGYARVIVLTGPKRIKGNRIRRMAHRFSYELRYGKIPKGKQLHHICHNRSCVNPEHLQLTTKNEHPLIEMNTITSINARKTHCKRGHPFNKENTYLMPNGGRACRKCKARYITK